MHGDKAHTDQYCYARARSVYPVGWHQSYQPALEILTSHHNSSTHVSYHEFTIPRRAAEAIIETPGDWITEMIRLGLQLQTLHETNIPLLSASKITYQHYLLLHVLREIQREPFNPERHGLTLFMGQAALNLGNYPSWASYLVNFPPNPIQEGSFSVVRREQARTARNPNAPAADEQIVNTSLAYFLMALGFPDAQYLYQEWTLRRLLFVAFFDGALVDERLGTVHAILETKKTNQRVHGNHV
ncbi:hypothetical protein F5884DRAFT_752122 [Xylogone sp. PMI_703]|nr:hypothetical protein F5884DRAFT_752122 [Xylogone sp. PMI_703]